MKASSDGHRSSILFVINIFNVLHKGIKNTINIPLICVIIVNMSDIPHTHTQYHSTILQDPIHVSTQYDTMRTSQHILMQ